MSSDAKAWKKQLLRSRGVEVIEYDGDYSTAVAQGRKEAESDPFSYFVDDENSMELFLGYAVAALRLKAQLEKRNLLPTPEKPLFVYLPCGVGGAPGGICFGLKMLFGDAVHCFFSEPVDAPCMLLGLATGKHAGISVYDIGLNNQTSADGLAVGRPSAFVGKLMTGLLAGCFTVEDETLAQYQQMTRQLEQLKIEPSAAAGFPGPAEVLKSGFCEQYNIAPGNITHILWTTGGRYLPEE
jgi:D-serine dehydratase